MNTIFALLAAGLGLVAAQAANPPDRTFFVSQSTQKGFGNELQLIEYSGTSHTTRAVVSANLGSNDIDQTALLHAGTQADPILVGLDKRAKALFVIRPNQNFPAWKVPALQARALTELDADNVLFAGDDNELYSMDALGAEKQLADKYLIDQGTYGPIKRMQMLDPGIVGIVTKTHYLVVNFDPTLPKPLVAQAVDLGALNLNGNTFYEGLDLVASVGSVWVLGMASPNGVPASNSQQTAVLLDMAKNGQLVSSLTLGNSQFVQLLDYDSTSREALIRFGDDYERLKPRLNFPVMEEAGAFNDARLSGLGAPLPRVGTLLVDHPRSGLPWLSRAGAPAPTAPIPTPAITPAPTTQRSPTFEEPEKVEEPKAAPKKKVLDPVSADDFREVMKRELGPLPDKLTLEQLAERINKTDSLRFYFQTLTPEELKELGLKRQMYWVSAIEKRAGDAASPDALAEALSKGRTREICERKLTNP